MGPSEEAEALGRTLAEQLQAAGAADILSAARNGVTG